MPGCRKSARMVLEYRDGDDSQRAALSSIAPKIGCTSETLRIWLCQYERDAGDDDGGHSTTERQHLAGLRFRGVHYRRVRRSHRGLAVVIVDV